MATTLMYKGGNPADTGKNALNYFYDVKAIETYKFKAPLSRFSDKRYMPTRQGNTYVVDKFLHSYARKPGEEEFNKYGYISHQGVSDISSKITSDLLLTEGPFVKKESVTYSKVQLSATLKRYGAGTEYTGDLATFSNEDVQINLKQEVLGYLEVMYEYLVQLSMLSTNTVLYGGMATSMSTIGQGLETDGRLDKLYTVNFDTIRSCVELLKRNGAKKVTSVITGSTKIDTKTIPASYYAIIGPEVKADLEDTVREFGAGHPMAFIPVHQYASAGNILEDEVGCLHEVRFIESQELLVYKGAGADVPEDYVGNLSYTGKIGSGAKFDVFPILFPTEGSFATVGLRGRNKITFNSKDPNIADSTDRYGNIGWMNGSFYFAAFFTKEECFLKCLVAASR